MTTSNSNRQHRSGTFDVYQRISLLEEDVDEMEIGISSLVDELKGIKNVLVGLLISIATASVLLAINIVVNSQ